ncbi:MAG: DUF805 domain-containing protein [Alphaproteobacteria bacterium]|jgi:uncharacterized membrane protein YhaH (DUF805 family)
MTLAQWFSHRGRISRKTWWIFYCLVWICLMGVLVEARRIILLGVETPQKSSVVEYIIITVFKVLGLMMLWGGFAGLIKRWHDQDQSCWWIVLLFVPNYFFILFDFFLSLADLDGSSRWDYRWMGGFFASMTFFLLPVTLLSAGFQPGTPGPNRFGPDPLAPPDTTNIALPPQPQ